MADIAPANPMAQTMEQAGNPADNDASTGNPPAGQAPPAPNPVDQAQQQQDQTTAPTSSDEQRPKGTVEDQRKAILAKNPNAKLPATPVMQAQYVQVVTRFMLMIHDMRQSNPKLMSPADAALKQMNNPKLNVAQAVGRTTAQLMFILHNAAKHQKVAYNPNVLFRAADECCAVTYLLGNARGIFNGVPKFKGKKAGVHYKFDPAEMKILYHAKIYAVQWFGKLMTKTGQLSPDLSKQAQTYWDAQIKREIASGKVTDAHIAQIMKDPKVAAQLQGISGGGNPPPGNNASISSSSANPDQNQQPPPAQGGAPPPAQGAQPPPPAPPPAGGPGGGIAPPSPPQQTPDGQQGAQ